MGASAGFGTSGLSSVGANMAKADMNSKQTVLTSLTGNKVDISVQENTTLKGATIASVDKEGNDNNNLTLKTDTLHVSSLNNTLNSKSISVGINVGGSIKDNTASNVALNFSNDTTNKKTKTLATLGNGNIFVANKEDSDTKMLNSDIANNEVDIYDISSHKGLKGELDTRLLTEEGRAEIKEDAKKAGEEMQELDKILPSANNENEVLAGIGKTLNLLNTVSLGIIPSDDSDGGLIGQIPVLFGQHDVNQKVIKVVSKDSLYMKENPDSFVAMKDSDYYKNASKETKDMLDLRSDLYVSKVPIKVDKNSATYQNATNGMMNTEADAIKNAINQTHKKADDIDKTVNLTLNYNPTHGLLGDGLESLVDKVGGTTGMAEQTGEFIRDVTTARGKDGSNFAAHSQANILTKSGIEYINEISINNPALGFLSRDYYMDTTKATKKEQEAGIPTFKGYGSPINTEDMDGVIGEYGLKYNYKGMTTNSHDFVGEVLGGNEANNEDRGLIRLTDPINPVTYIEGLVLFTDYSPHSTYKCNPANGDMCGDKK
ncbi:hypothetical protein HUE87_05075 [Candidatus Sulfurimonas marisnigri]|uniref:Uncharacterized protein n=1 Tax=Candidatus Sulfurimonas marisnigri TaxID=2740405 RepID=A0A7S7RRF2_9BACT|nr:hypothetical protein [Candidatus Sulfurimonas marisnigri]QOY55603.1 hypothetical protein HUE87_05075 [Candidatus Sulfurimonas marisnigri]